MPNKVQFTMDPQSDWHIFLCEDQLDLVITTQQRYEMLNWAMQQFTEWVIKARIFDMTYDRDPPWNHSGETIERRMEERDRLKIMRGTLGEWMENLTGNWTATYISHDGKAHNTYEDEVRDHISFEVHQIFKAQVEPQRWEEIWDSDELTPALLILEETLIDHIASISAALAYRQFEASVRQKIARRKLQGQSRQLAIEKWRQQAQRFWTEHFPLMLPNTHIDKPTWRNLKLATQLQEALDQADPADIEAILEVGLPGNFSNSVCDEIRRIVLEFSEREI